MNEIKKLLDNGWFVTMFRNQLGSYTAFAHPVGVITDIEDMPEDWITDDFEPDKALNRLCEKVLKTGQYA